MAVDVRLPNGLSGPDKCLSQTANSADYLLVRLTSINVLGGGSEVESGGDKEESFGTVL